VQQNGGYGIVFSLLWLVCALKGVTLASRMLDLVLLHDFMIKIEYIV